MPVFPSIRVHTFPFVLLREIRFTVADATERKAMRTERTCRPSTGRTRVVLEQYSLRMTPDTVMSFYPHGMFGRFSVRVRRVAGWLPKGVAADVLLALAFMLAATFEQLVRLGVGATGSSAAVASVPLASLALRRSRPLLGLQLLVVVAAVGSLAKALLPSLPASSTDVTVPIIALLVMTYSLGAHGTGREVVVGVFQPL